MNFKKTMASLLAGAVVGTAALTALAAPASANDEGSTLPGQIYLFANTGGFTNPLNTASALSTSGTGAARPFQSLTVENVCPADAVSIQASIRVPVNGQPENEWTQIPITAASNTADSAGRFYTGRSDLLTKPEAMTYLAGQPGNTGQFPLIVACTNYDGLGVGIFRTMLTMTGSASNLTWSVATPTLPLSASTTTLAASATTVESGTSVDLTATVAPAAATGSVEFFAGATSLGTAAVAAGTATLSTSALPVGTNSVTAQYLGGSHAASTSAPVSITVTAVAPRATTTTLAVSPTSGANNQSVTFTTTVTSVIGAPNGTVTFKDGATVLGSLPVVSGVVASFSTNVLGAGTHSLTAEFVGTAPYTNSVSAAVPATYTLVGAVDEQTVTVDIPQGIISITTPYTPAAPLALGIATLDPSDSTYSASAPFNDIYITDSRAGNLGFTASVVSSAFVGATGSFPGIHAGLTGLVPVQMPGNALQAANVVVTNHAPFTDGLDVPKVFATYAAGQTIGTAAMNGVFGVDQVPTSVAPGLYTATVTFTAV